MKKTAFAMAAVVASMLSHAADAQPAVDRLERRIEEPPQAGGEPPPLNEQAGYLGIIADDRRDRGQGVRVLDVVAGGPADRGGLRIGDLITEIDGKSIRGMEEFASFLSNSHPEQRVSFTVSRGDRALEHVVTLGHRPSPVERRVPQFGGPPASPLPKDALAEAPRKRLLGVRTLPVNDQVRRFFNIPEARGALVSEVVPGSPADKAGLPRDAIIVALDGVAVGDPTDLARLVAEAGEGREVELTYFSRGQLLKKKLTLGQYEPAPGENAAEPAPTENQVPAAGPPSDDKNELRDRLQRLELRLRRLEMILERMMPPGAPPGGVPSSAAPGET